jgi:hypothetical protein
MRLPVSRRLAALIAYIGLSGCDTLHGFQISAPLNGQSQSSTSCLETGIRSAGMRSTSQGSQLKISEQGTDSIWFIVDSSNPSFVRIYLLTMNRALPCSSITQVVPRMRRAMQLILESCYTSEQRPAIKELWQSQESCGL